jgi:phage FluMu protein Com
MTPEGLRPIRCQSCGKLICEADGTVVFRCPRCKRRNAATVRPPSAAAPQ